MKRLWFGLALLVMLLAAGIFTSAVMNRLHQPISGKLNQAADTAQENDLPQTAALLQSAKKEWDQYRRFSASVADHEPIEEIEAYFAQAQVYLAAGKAEECAASCAYLSILTRAMADAHTLTWWNLL